MSANQDTAMVFSSTITDAQFRIWGALINSVFNAGDFDRTADTGQIDWTTVAYPGVNNTTAGYEIRTFSDAGTPLVFKLEYGRAAGTGTTRIGVTVGTGSDGAGTITGVLFAQQFFLAIHAANTFWVSVSADASRASIMSWASPGGVAAASTGFLLHFERTADANRTINNNGAYLAYNNAQTSPSLVSRFIKASGTQPVNESGAAGIWDCNPPTASSVTSGVQAAPSSDKSTFPIACKGIGTTELPFLGITGGFVADFTGGTDYVINIRGVNQTMKMAGLSTLGAVAKGGTSVGPAIGVFSLLMRYE